VDSGVPGVVVFAATDYAVTRDHTLANNVSMVGTPAAMTFSGDVPDAEFSVTGGTRLILSPGVTGLKFNAVDRVAEEANIAEASLCNVRIFGLSFIGGLRGIKTGAYLAMGAVWCEFDRLFFMDQTGDYAFDAINFQHCIFGTIYQSSGNLTSGGGVRLASALSGTLLPGNSTVVGEIYTYCKHRRNRSVMIEAFGPSGCVLNQMKVAGRLQGNRYGAASPDSISMSFTNGSPNIVVANNTHFETLVVDMPVAFDSTVAGFAIRTVYFVRTRNTGDNTVTLAETPYATSSINATATTTGTARCSGFPSVSIVARDGAAISHGDFGLIDAEAFGNVCAVLIAKTRFCVAYLAEIMTSTTGTGLVCRDVFQGLTYGGQLSLTQDESALFGQVSVKSDAGGPFAYSGGSFTLDASHNNRAYRYTGTSDITITVPNNLPKGFEFQVTTTGATGVVTFAGSAGGAVLSFGNKLRTAGQNATASLRNIANRVYQLSGDLQV